MDEREFDYGGKSPRKMIPHLARFIAQIWQVHPFGEGNTRTTAVFAIKYLSSLGYRVENNMFRDNSWYFRNALVRANYADYAHGVKRDWSYLEAFFRNLLLGEKNEMKSRYLLIGLTDDDKQKIRELTEGRKRLSEKGGQKTTQKTVVKTARKTVVKAARKTVVKAARKTVVEIIRILKEKPRSTRMELASATGLSVRGIEWNLQQLKAAGRLRRVGPDKGGHWEVLDT